MTTEISSPGAARAVVRQALDAHVPLGAVDDAQLLMSELVTNALLHGRAPVEIDVQLERDHVALAVVDRGGGEPHERASDPVGGGYGLPIVNAIADHVEYEVTAGRTEVRCWLPLHP